MFSFAKETQHQSANTRTLVCISQCHAEKYTLPEGKKKYQKNPAASNPVVLSLEFQLICIVFFQQKFKIKR